MLSQFILIDDQLRHTIFPEQLHAIGFIGKDGDIFGLGNLLITGNFGVISSPET